MNGIKIATAHSHSFQSGAFSFMPCTSGRESLPLDENESSQPIESKTESKKKKFHPLRNLRRMFRRKGRRSSISADSYQPGVTDSPETGSGSLEQRSCSTSRLQEDNLTQNYIANNNNNNNNNRLNPGLSLSHDSIFTPERADSGLSSSDLGNSSLSITILTPASRECIAKSQQSSCSETSLISIGSSEVDELSPVRNKKLSDLDVGVTSYKLSHSAAKHKMAVKPKRNHGAPRARRKTLISISPLPTTLEVNEEKVLDQSSPSVDWDDDPFCKFNCSREQTEKSTATKSEDGHQSGREEDGVGQRTESFFGRFLSRRSEKKKKNLQPSNFDEGNVEDKSSSLGKRLGKSNRSPNRRQRVEPMEIPSTGGFNGDDSKEVKAVSDSTSPSRSAHWPNKVTSRSMSPPKSVWPDSLVASSKNEKEKIEGALLEGWAGSRAVERSSSEKLSNELRNSDFMKELTNSINLIAKDESGRRKKCGEDEEYKEREVKNEVSYSKSNDDNDKMAIKVVRSESKEEMAGKTIILVENETDEPDAEVKPNETSTSQVLTIQVNSQEDQFSHPRILFSHEESLTNDRGYSEVNTMGKQVKEKVDEDGANCRKDEGEDVKVADEVVMMTPKAMEKDDVKINKSHEKAEVVKTEPEAMKRVKPVVSQKPKDLKRIGNGGYVTGSKTKATEKESKSGVEMETETSPLNKTSVNLIEKRKSELLLLTDTAEKDWKPSSKPSMKEPCFKVTSAPESVETESDTLPSSLESPKLGIYEEVVFRRKIHAGQTDDQPELMKVFARRSLKIRETEKAEEDLQRSRDSDKENETSDSLKEERKKSFEAEEKKDVEGRKEGTRNSMLATTTTTTTTTTTSTRNKSTAGTTALTIAASGNEYKMNVDPLKPEVTVRCHINSRYGRSISESNVRKEETESKMAVLEESNVNKLGWKIAEMAGYHVKEDEEINGGSGGFKRIQQRKAEWEMRAQQSTK